MNWTGGRLQQSKNANKGVIQKQKAHFARARTQLQNAETTGGSPVHSAKFHDGCVSLGHQLPLSSSRAIRHIGHSTTLQDHDRSKGASPARQDNLGARVVAERRRLHGHDAEDCATAGNTNSRYHRDEGVNDGESLLDAKRKRLLQQSDWAGLVRLKTPEINHKAKDDRETIGKRRKTIDHHALTISKTKSRLVPCPFQIETSRQSRQDTGGALQDGNIRIRIGTEALTNATPIHALSESQEAAMSYDTSSESMLLDNEDLHVVAPQTRHSVVQDPRRLVGAPSHTHGPRKPVHGRLMKQNYQLYREGKGSVPCAQEQDLNASSEDGNLVQWSEDPAATDNLSPNEDDEVRDCYITQHVNGIARPLRLTFDALSESSAGVSTNNASRTNLIGQTSNAHSIANAATKKKGSARTEAAVGSRPRTPHNSDDGPWRVFLPACADSPSLSIGIELSAFGGAPDRRSQSSLLPCAESWSQQAAQGMQTLGDQSSCASLSLPSITRGSDKDKPQERLHLEADGVGRRPKKKRDENDRFWQRLVFGSDRDGSINPHETKAQPREIDTIAGNRIASSVAVSLSSTPFNPLSEPGSCVSDSAQDATSRAPRLTSSGSMLPIITSSSRGQAVESNKDRCGYKALQQAESSGVGLEWVTHTSMQNNVSCDGDASPPRISGDSARASRISLNGQEHCRHGRFGPTWVSRGVPTSIYDIPVSTTDEADDGY